jgi:hypothetical protein
VAGLESDLIGDNIPLIVPFSLDTVHLYCAAPVICSAPLFCS